MKINTKLSLLLISGFCLSLKFGEIYGLKSTSFYSTQCSSDKGSALSSPTSSSLFNGPYYTYQDYLKVINYDDVFPLFEYKEPVRLAIIDSGFDDNHPDAPENINYNLSKSFSNVFEPFGDSTAYQYHGTAIAGIIAAKTNNRTAIVGIIPDVEIISISIGRISSDKRVVYDSSEIVEAINYAEEIDVDIINYSAGGFTAFNQDEYNAIKNFSRLFVTAAGNNFDEKSNDLPGYNIDENDYYPASYDLDNIVVVGSVENISPGTKTLYSNFGENAVDIMAPGRDIATLNAGLYNNFYKYDGTSFAAPQVAAVAAAILTQHPGLSTESLKEIILNTAIVYDTLDSYCLTSGVLNAYKFIHYYHNYSSYTYVDTKYHIGYCDCGYSLKSGHVVAGGAFEGGERYATCLECGGLAEMGFVIGPLNSNSNVQYEKIGDLYYPLQSYIENDILDLSYEDYLKFIGGLPLEEIIRTI